MAKKAKRVSLSWEDFAKSLGVKYSGADEFAVSDSGWEQAQQFSKEYEKDYETKLTDDEMDAVSSEIQMAIEDHWSLPNVLEHNFNIDKVIDRINDWGKRGAQAAIYDSDVEMPAGEAVKWVGQDADGLTFELYPPFETAYAEAAYCVHSIAHEGNKLSDFKADDVGRVGRWIAECEGDSIGKLDLDRWDERRNKPKWNDLVAVVEGMRKPKKKTRKRKAR